MATNSMPRRRTPVRSRALDQLRLRSPDAADHRSWRETYRARYITPFERHLHHHGGYGRPFPPRYARDLFADRGVTAGELGVSPANAWKIPDAVFVPDGRRNVTNCTALKQHPAVLLANYDAKKPWPASKPPPRATPRSLTAFSSLGYDSMGYGYGAKDAKDGTPILQTAASRSSRMNTVWPVHRGQCLGARPSSALTRARIGADVMAYSMDKAIRRADRRPHHRARSMWTVPIRRALGYHSDRPWHGLFLRQGCVCHERSRQGSARRPHRCVEDSSRQTAGDDQTHRRAC